MDLHIELPVLTLGHLMRMDPGAEKFIESLPRLTESDLHALGKTGDSCPICLTSFDALLASEELAHAMDSPAAVADEMGVTRLRGSCGHVFCRKDIVTWVRGGNSSCPACRRALFETDPATAAMVERRRREVAAWMAEHMADAAGEQAQVDVGGGEEMEAFARELERVPVQSSGAFRQLHEEMEARLGQRGGRRTDELVGMYS